VVTGLHYEELAELKANAKTGDALSQLQLARYYLSLSPTDDFKAIRLLRKAAFSDFVPAQSWLGYVHCKSDEHRDYQEGNKWLYVAAIAGDAFAQFNLGVSYQFGYGVEQDDFQSLFWYQLAALSNYPRALAKVGSAYVMGLGAEKDEELGDDILVLAADLGDFDARVYVDKFVKGDKCLAFQTG
jgi:uncharacterized protein